MINNIIANIIWFVHACIILFVIGAPITDSPYFLMLHTVFIPFMILHWVTNNDTCVLTTVEKHLKNVKTKEDEEDCFTCRLINPIFNFNKNNKELSKYIYLITIILWLISLVKLLLKYKNGKITKLEDLFVIKQK